MNKQPFFDVKLFLFFIIVSCLLLQHSAAGQAKRNLYRDSLFNKYALASIHEFNDANPYYIIAWEGPILPNLKIVRQLDEGLAIVQLKNQNQLQLLKQRAKISGATDAWKFSPDAERLLANNNKEHIFILSSFDTDTLLNVLNKMRSLVKIISVNQSSHTVVVSTNAGVVKSKLLLLKEIIFIDIRATPRPEASILGYDRSFDGINAVDYSIPGADGENIVAGVKEQTMDKTDLDLYKRVLTSPVASPSVTQHATVISSIIGGAGNRFYDGRGLAPACKFFPSSFDNLFADDASILNANKVTVQNHSYGTVIQQFYGAEAVSYDVQAWQDKSFIHVFSAGNEGTSFAIDGPYANIPGYANLTGNFKMAKNVITVGAIDNKENIPPQSSSGPLYDGRLAPQLIALGSNGTSDAAAVVTGTVAVIQQVYADSNNQSLPAASLVKAVLYNTADDVYHAGIDYKTGYGLLNSYQAVRSVQQKEYDGGSVMQGQAWIKTITVPNNAAQLKITLAWTDTTATVNNNKALINDLDLEVQNPNSGTIYKPWVLDATPQADSLSKPPTRKRDSLNTAEQVSIQLPAAGNYVVRVLGTAVSSTFLPFNIAWHIDTLNRFVFTSPQHTSDVNLSENPSVFVRWRTFVADTNQTGNLYISYNNRKSWQLLQQSYKIYKNEYLWTVKDTNSRAVLKMETSFGDFFSKDFVISKVLRPSVDFFCTDSFRLSWNKYVYAGAYRIYALTDSPYLKHILTVSDTFIVIKRSDYPELIYAIEPALTNNIPAARSIAIDVAAQGVQCFYNTLYYTLLANNALQLVLQLGATAYVDSIFFEQVTPDDHLLQTYGGIKVKGNDVYRQKVNDVPAGASYWRAKIKLKNGEIVYTDIISVITSGRKYILFYPNPVLRNGVVNYILQQDLPTDSKLQLFDITGRLLRNYKEMPNTIDLRNIAPGVLIYKLFSGGNEFLEAGKLVVQ